MNGKITSRSLKDDIQAATSGFYEKGIAKVGTRGTRLPFSIIRKDGSVHHTVASISSYCSLDASKKGINMSRIARTATEVFSGSTQFENFEGVKQSVIKMKQNHGSDSAWIKVKFEYLLKKQSPMSEEVSYEPVYVEMESKIDKDGTVKNFLTVERVVMSLCPCSKNMSMLYNNLTEDEFAMIKRLMIEDILSDDLYNKLMKAGFGAHNQKSVNKVTVELADDSDGNVMWIEDLIDIIDQSGSSPTYSVLKRPDEKYVTEVSYMGGFYDDEKNFVPVEGAGPKFVEDISRDIACKLDDEMGKRINDYVVVTENFESIHSSDITAIAILTAGKDLN